MNPPVRDDLDPLLAQRMTELLRSNEGLRGDVRKLRMENEDLRRRLAELQSGSDFAHQSRRAALNLLEDAELARLAERQSTDALRTSEERYRALFDSMEEGYCILQLVFDKQNKPIDYRFLVVNGAFVQHSGIANAVGKSVHELASGMELISLKTLGKVALTGEPARFSNYIAPLDRWFDVYAARIGDPEELRISVLFNDITVQKRHELNRSFLAAVTEKLSAVNDTGEVVQVLGEEVSNFFGASHCAFIHVNETGESAMAFDEWHRSGEPNLAGEYKISEYVTEAYRSVLASGQAAVVADVASDPLIQNAEKFAALGIRSFVNVPFIRNGRWQFAVGVYHDRPYLWRDDEVTILLEAATRIWEKLERIRAQQTLRRSEERYRTLFTAIDEGFFVCEAILDPSGEATDILFLEANPAASRITGMDFIGRKMRDLLPGYKACWYAIVERVARTGVAERSEQFAAPLGKWLDSFIFRIGGEENNHLAIVFHDITERKRGQERLETLADAVPQIIWANAADGTANYFNKRWYEYSGLSFEESFDQGWQAIVHPEDAPAATKAWQQALAAGKVFDYEYRLRGTDGIYRWFVGRTVPVYDAEEQSVISWFGTATDIDDLKTAQHDLKVTHAELEIRIKERTRDLSAALDKLRFESARRAKVEDARKELLARVVNLQEEERTRISRELHDNLGQHMVAVKFGLDSLQNDIGDGSAASQFEKLRREVDLLIQAVHRQAWELRPAELDHLGLEVALEHYVSDWSKRSGIRSNFRTVGSRRTRLGADVEITFYRIVQEALTNVARHSKARHVDVILTLDGGGKIAIEDDGVGFRQDDVKNRLGLLGMRERLALVHGELEVISALGSGTKIRAIWKNPAKPRKSRKQAGGMAPSEGRGTP